MKKPTKVFAYVDALSFTKDVSVLNDPDFAKEYVPFVVNRALSYHEDAIVAANLMNERSTLEPALQFRFLLNTIRPRKRYSKWLKPTVSDDVRVVAEYYECSLRQARDLVSLHTSDQLTHMQARLEKGGTTNKGTRNDSST